MSAATWWYVWHYRTRSGAPARRACNTLRCAREIGGGKRCGRAAGEWMPASGMLYPLSRRQRAAEDQR